MVLRDLPKVHDIRVDLIAKSVLLNSNRIKENLPPEGIPLGRESFPRAEPALLDIRRDRISRARIRAAQLALLGAIVRVHLLDLVRKTFLTVSTLAPPTLSSLQGTS